MLDLSFILFLQSIRNSLFDILSIILAVLFSTLIAYPAIAVTYIITNKKVFLYAITSMVLGGIPTLVLKEIIQRPRPGMDIFGAWSFAGGSSMPSGHTMIAFALCGIIFWYVPRLRPSMVALPVMVGLSRMYLGVHYLSDVLAGAFIGLAASVTVIALQKQIDAVHNKLNKLRQSIIK